MAAIELILLQRVEKLGQMGDKVRVKPGYARNFLLPQRKAIRANKDNLAKFETERVQLEAQIAELKRRGIMLGCGGGNFCAANSVIRQEMAVYLARTFDLPVLIDTNTSRNVNFAYTQGMLTGVTSGATTYGTLAYHPNLLVSQVAHGNGVVNVRVR